MSAFPAFQNGCKRARSCRVPARSASFRFDAGRRWPTSRPGGAPGPNVLSVQPRSLPRSDLLVIMFFETMPWRRRALAAFGCASARPGDSAPFLRSLPDDARDPLELRRWRCSSRAQSFPRRPPRARRPSTRCATGAHPAPEPVRPRTFWNSATSPAGHQGAVSRGLRPDRGDAGGQAAGSSTPPRGRRPSVALVIPLYHYIGSRKPTSSGQRCFWSSSATTRCGSLPQ
jgi:hypothetical protein